MHARERIIRERFARRVCAECGHLFTPGGVLVLARRRSAWMVLVTCPTCEHRSIFVVTFPAGAADVGARWQPQETPVDVARVHELLPSAAPSAPISDEDVARMREFLSQFDGNFQRIFA